MLSVSLCFFQGELLFLLVCITIQTYVDKQINKQSGKQSWPAAVERKSSNMPNKCTSVHFQLTASLDLANCCFLLCVLPAWCSRFSCPRLDLRIPLLLAQTEPGFGLWFDDFRAWVLGIESRCKKGWVQNNWAILREQKVDLLQAIILLCWTYLLMNLCMFGILWGS